MRGKEQQRARAIEAMQEWLPLMGLQPEQVEAVDVLSALQEFGQTQSQNIAYQWWLSADDRQLTLFLTEWEAWRETTRAKCAFCQGGKERPDQFLCSACSDLFESSDEMFVLPF